MLGSRKTGNGLDLGSLQSSGEVGGIYGHTHGCGKQKKN